MGFPCQINVLDETRAQIYLGCPGSQFKCNFNRFNKMEIKDKTFQGGNFIRNLQFMITYLVGNLFNKSLTTSAQVSNKAIKFQIT